MSSHYERDPEVPPLRIEPLPRRDGAAPHRADPEPVDPGPSYADFLERVTADDVDTDGAPGEAG